MTANAAIGGLSTRIKPIAHAPKRWWKNMALQLAAAILFGIAVGSLFPGFALKLRPLADLFIKLIKMVIGPVVFLSIATGVSHIGDLKKVGRIGIRTLIYFEVLTTLALLIGLAAVYVGHPGAGINPPHVASTAQFASYGDKKPTQSFLEYVVGIIPDNAVAMFSRGDILSIVFFALLFGISMLFSGSAGKTLERALDNWLKVFFGIINLVMRVAPLAAFGAIAFVVANFGAKALLPLTKLILCTYVAAAFFLAVVLGIVCRLFGFRLWPLLRYLKEEMLVVIGTSSSESVLPALMEKLESFGVSRSVVGLVVPTGYSFNMDGLALSLPISTIFIAQVYHVPLTLHQIVVLLGIILITSKGAAGITGVAFVALATTVAATGFLPLEGLALILGVESFLSMARAITNVTGNAVAAVVIAKMSGEFRKD